MAKRETAQNKVERFSKELKLVTKECKRYRLELEKLRDGKMISDYIRALYDVIDIVGVHHTARYNFDGNMLCMALLRQLNDAKRKGRRKAGIAPTFHFHDLRHTFASHQKMPGVDDYTLMAIMGHSDSKMMRRYAHLTPEHKRNAINSLPEWNSSKDGQKLVRNSDSVIIVKRSVSSQSFDYIGTNSGG